jgi:hypothetical protein
MTLAEPKTAKEKDKAEETLKKNQLAQRKKEKNLAKIRVDNRTEILIKKGDNPAKRIELFKELNNQL